jgi:hypothetical protein
LDLILAAGAGDHSAKVVVSAMNDALQHIYESAGLVCMGGCGMVFIKQPPYSFMVATDFIQRDKTIVAASCYECMEKNQDDPRGFVLRHLRKRYPDIHAVDLGNG